ncbi:9298_t:CDS:2, partial [Rhizophagus irregularis]
EYLKSKIFEAKQKEEDAEKKLIILENVAEIYYQSSQNELKEILKQKNFQLEQNYQNLRLSSAVQIREFTEKENTLQDQIICLQNEKNEKKALAEQEKMNLQEKLAQTEANIQELKFQQESLIGQKEQLENKLSQSQVNSKLEKELAQLEQKLINEEQIKEQLTQALQIKEDKINELEQKLIGLDYEHIKKLNNRRKKLNEVEKELVNKLTKLQLASYNANRKKLVFNQVNNFLKAKGDFLALREEAIRKLQNCYTSKERNTIRITRDMVSVEDKISKINVVNRHTKEFQNILIKYNNGLIQLNKKYYSLKNIVQENKDLKISPMIKNILKLDSFSLDRHNIFRFATNSQEGARTQLNSSMMAEDINSLRKNLNELKSELKQEKKELNNLTTD